MDYDKYALLWQAKKSSDNHYAHKYLEKPAMASLLSNLNNKTILDLGCGSGEEVQELSINNTVIGLDNSAELLNLAQLTNPQCMFWNIDLNKQLIPTDVKFDLIYSSLTLHYIEAWDSLFEQFYQLLNENGEIIFSTHHPIKWGSQTNKNKLENSFVMGYKKIKDDSKSFEIYGNYLDTYPIKEKLFQQLEIIHYNRSISSMINCFIKHNFEIIELLEPKPIIEAQKDIPDFYEVHSKIPLFVLFKLRKKSRIYT